MKRTAIKYSDGSFNVHPENWPMRCSWEQAEDDNKSTTPKCRAQLVEVEIEVTNVIDDYSRPSPESVIQCPKCKHLQLRDNFCGNCGLELAVHVVMKTQVVDKDGNPSEMPEREQQ